MDSVVQLSPFTAYLAKLYVMADHESEQTWWHGTPDERTWEHGSKYGIHVGTYEAAKTALEARIGKPHEGEWDGTREYGKTLLNRDYTSHEFDPATRTWTRHTQHQEPAYPSGQATYSADAGGHSATIPMDARPHVFPVRIKGPMTNTPDAPHEDFKANGYMAAALKRGNARRGYFYKNVSEDEGSVSAVVPSAAHLERIRKERTAATRPVEPEQVHPHEFEGLPLYHGSPHDFRDGDVLTPEGGSAHAHDQWDNADHQAGGHVYTSRSPDSAEYAANQHPDAAGMGYVYQVEHLGPAEHDHVFDANRGQAGLNFRTRHPVRVVRKVGDWREEQRMEHEGSAGDGIEYSAGRWAGEPEPKTASVRDDQLAAMDPHTRASAQAQENVRSRHPMLWRQLDSEESGGQAVLRHWLGQAGHPRAEDAYVVRHRDPSKGTSNTARGPDGEPAVALHQDRYDYGTLAHETAHLIVDHETGRMPNQPPAEPEGVHGPRWAAHYTRLLNNVSRGAGDDYQAERHQYLGAEPEHTAGREEAAPDPIEAEAAAHTAAMEPQPGGLLPNPMTGHPDWYHGTQASREELHRGFDDPADNASEAYETPDAQEGGHWNRFLGTHFAASHELAGAFAAGEHSSGDNDRGDDAEPAVVHARLSLKNPKVYSSEHAIDDDVYEHEHVAGNRIGDHLEGDDEEREATWPTAHALDKIYGDRQIPKGACSHVPREWGIESQNPDRTEWMNGHPDRFNISQRFKARLEAAGHDGIVYRNEYEDSGEDHPHADTAAIAFHPHQVHITSHHDADEPSDAPEPLPAREAALGIEAAADTSYRGQHQGPGEEHGAPLHKIDDVMPDFYDHPEYYSAGEPRTDRESIRQIRRARGNPEADVHIYRALPHGHREINRGDWVTTSGNYAKDHAYASGDDGGDWPVLKATVKARHLRSQGDEPNEFSYHGPDIEHAEFHHPGTGHTAAVLPVTAEDDQPPKGARFFHGRTGTYPASPGDILTPQRGGMKHMYYTTHLPTASRAAAYGQPLNERGYQNLDAESLPGHVYEVVPETAAGKRVGRHAADPDNGLPGAEQSWRTKGRLRVLHEVHRETGEPLSGHHQAAALPAPARHGFSPVAQASEALTAAIAGYDPGHMGPASEWLGDLPLFFDQQGIAFGAMATRLREDYPLAAGVADHYDGLSATLAELADQADEGLRLFRTAHRHDLERQETPRTNEDRWDVDGL